MREVWSDKRLGEVCELVNGRGFKPHEWKKEGLPIIRIQNLNGSSEFNFYSGDFAPKILVQPGQLLFAWSGSRGASFGPHIWQGPKGVLNYHTWKVHPADGTDRDFLYQLLEYETLKIEATSHGASALVHVQKKDMEQRSLPFPPLPEQRVIAKILRTWDEALEKLTALRAAKQDWLTGVTQKLIGRGGVFPDAWDLKPLNAIATRVRRKNDGGDHPVMTISAKFGFLMQSDKFARDMAGSSVDNYTLLHQGEFAYNKGNSLAAKYGCIYQLDRPTAVVPFVYFCFALKSGLDANFYSHLFAAGALNHQLSRLINSGVRNDGLLNLNVEDFFGCKVPVPPIEDQRRIGEALTTAKHELSLLDEEIEALTRQKRGLMQKLLTGEWPVNVEGAVD